MKLVDYLEEIPSKLIYVIGGVIGVGFSFISDNAVEFALAFLLGFLGAIGAAAAKLVASLIKRKFDKHEGKS